MFRRGVQGGNENKSSVTLVTWVVWTPSKLLFGKQHILNVHLTVKIKASEPFKIMLLQRFKRALLRITQSEQ